MSSSPALETFDHSSTVSPSLSGLTRSYASVSPCLSTAVIGRPTIEAVTLTGGRQLAFELCETWISKQTRPPDFWTVVDDVEEPTITTMGQTVIRRIPFWEPGQRTLNVNLRTALEAEPRADVIAIIEDDDHYGPEWFETIEAHFVDFPGDVIFGEGWTTYYNVQTQRWLRNSNSEHASLCATAWRSSLNHGIHDLLCTLKPQSPFVDALIWRDYGDQGTIARSQNVTGIKGLPGRPGCGRGHDAERSLKWTPDFGGNYLKTLIGPDDAALYRGLAISPPKFPPSNAMPDNMRRKGLCSLN